MCTHFDILLEPLGTLEQGHTLLHSIISGRAVQKPVCEQVAEARLALGAAGVGLLARSPLQDAVRMVHMLAALHTCQIQGRNVLQADGTCPFICAAVIRS